ncbi:MAG: hypothetical protein GY804_00520 [Alphaproteobacteria bacterium]|nr:hypothetical protein [Alphaproteobacteria bacterium]
MKYLLLGLLFVLSGCAGKAAYQAKPISINGKIVCCEITIDNSKDIELVEVIYESTENGNTKLHIKEAGVKTNAAIASQRQAQLLEAVTAAINPKGNQ